MEKKIYLPGFAKDQLKTSDDASVWSRKIEYKDKPEPGFNYEAIVNDMTLSKGYYEPAMDEYIEDTIESLKEVKIKGKNLDKKLIEKKEKKEKKTLINKLNIEDFENPMFDKKRPVKRDINARPEIYHLVEEDYAARDLAEERYMMNPDDPNAEEAFMTWDFGPKKEPVIEGVTTTDNFNTVGYTYFNLDGMLHISYFDEEKGEGIKIFEEVINSYEEFDKALKQVDKKIKKILEKRD